MAINSPISDMFVRIKNANQRKKDKVDIPSSKLKEEILKILKDEGFISNYKVISDRKQGILRVYMKYSPEGERVIRDVKCISTPGRRCYRKSAKINKVFRGMGISIISTPKGLMTDSKCRELKMGGEVICSIW